jgi:hypothetical protein
MTVGCIAFKKTKLTVDVEMNANSFSKVETFLEDILINR